MENNVINTVSLGYDEKIGKSFIDINGEKVYVSYEFTKFLKDTNGVTPKNIELTCSKTGVKTLKVKNLTYTINGKTKVLNMYKTNLNNSKENKTMKCYVKFMKPKDPSKKNPFNNLITKVIKPVIKDKEYESLDAVRSDIHDALKPLENENSKWVIEDNTKTQGLVIKNEYTKEGREFASHNIFFINVAQVVEGK